MTGLLRTYCLAIVPFLAAACTAVPGDEGGGALDSLHGSTSRHGLLSERVGLALNVTGGNAAPDETHVTNAKDSGPGSLREALSGDTPRWIVFDGDYTINLLTTAVVGSNKTLDGRGRKVRITASGGRGTKSRVTGFALDHVSNVIFENLTLSDFGDPNQTNSNNPADGIDIDTSAGVWIDHCDLSVAADKLVSVIKGSTEVTISFNHFHDQEQNIQIGTQSTATEGDVLQTVLLYDNYFDPHNFVATQRGDATYQNSGYRHPVLAHGRVHMFNNVIESWSAYGLRSERGGRLYLEANVLAAAPGGNTAATKIRPQGVPDRGPPAGMSCAGGQQCVAPYKNVCGCNDNCKNCDPSPGFLRAKANLTLNGAVITENDPDLVEQQVMQSPEFSYAYDAQPATAALRSAVIAGAGPR